jgi:hypothetical protein
VHSAAREDIETRPSGYRAVPALAQKM